MPRPPALSSLAARVRGFIERAVTDRSWPRSAAAEGDFNALALQLFAAQSARNAAYRRLCDVRGVAPASVRGWREIPAVPTVAFKELELTCLPPRSRTAVFHSSGTTQGEPSRHFHSRESLALYEESVWAGFRVNVLGGMTSSPRLLVLTPPPAVAPHSSLVHMFDTVRRRLGARAGSFLGTACAKGLWTLDTAAAVSVIRGATGWCAPVLLLGTAFSFVRLLDALVQSGERLVLPPGSRVVETGGYKGRSRELPRAELHTLITGRLGVPPRDIVTEYGMSELGSQAYPHRHAAQLAGEGTACVLQFPAWARASVVSPETGREVADGETGLLRVVDLANVWSVIAIQTGDVAVRHGGGFELLGRAASAEPRGCSLMAA